MSIRLAKASGEALAKIQRGLRMPERPPLLRLALAVGLCNWVAGGSLEAEDSKGPEIPLKVITGGRDLLFDTLIVHVTGQRLVSPSDRRRAYKVLVDFGIQEIWSDYRASEQSGDYLIKVARACWTENGSLPGLRADQAEAGTA